MADEFDPFNYGFFGTPGNMYVLPGEGVGERADTGLTTPDDTSLPTVDPITGLPTTPVTSGSGFGDFLTGIRNLFTGTSSFGLPGQLAGLAGLAALLNRATGGGGPQFAGYRGGIPEYKATYTQTPLAQQRPAGYRPGQGGITYFNPIQYTKPGSDQGTTPAPATPTPTPSDSDVVTKLPIDDTGTGVTQERAAGGYMPGGIAMLAKGGGRFLRGPGDGVSDSIPATIADRQPARLADGEFVIDARTVSELGNGSSEAGARKLYEMMDRVHKARRTAKRGKPSGADKYLPK